MNNGLERLHQVGVEKLGACLESYAVYPCGSSIVFEVSVLSSNNSMECMMS